MVPLCITTEVILNNTLNTIPISYRWTRGSEKPKSLAKGHTTRKQWSWAGTRPSEPSTEDVVISPQQREIFLPKRGIRMLGTASTEDREPLGNTCQRRHLKHCHGPFGKPGKTAEQEKVRGRFLVLSQFKELSLLITGLAYFKCISESSLSQGLGHIHVCAHPHQYQERSDILNE